MKNVSKKLTKKYTKQFQQLKKQSYRHSCDLAFLWYNFLSTTMWQKIATVDTRPWKTSTVFCFIPFGEGTIKRFSVRHGLRLLWRRYKRVRGTSCTRTIDYTPKLRCRFKTMVVRDGEHAQISLAAAETIVKRVQIVILVGRIQYVDFDFRVVVQQDVLTVRIDLGRLVILDELCNWRSDLIVSKTHENRMV